MTLDLTESELERLLSFYSLGSNEKRLRVMLELVQEGELRFSDVMRIATNPKLAQDCLQPMVKGGLVVHKGRGSGYRLSEKAAPIVLALTLGLAKMLSELKDEVEGEEGGRTR